MDWRVFETVLRDGHLSIGAFAALVALLLLFTLRVALPPAERRYIRAPAAMLVTYVVTVAVRFLIPDGAPQLLQLFAVIGWFVLLLSIGRSSFLLVIDVLLTRRLTQPLPRIFRDIIQGVVYAAIALISLRAAGVEPGSLLTTSALLTAVIGLSLQDTLGNMFAGLAIQAQQPFEVGDWIQFDEKNEHVGHVVEINWRATRLRTVEDLEVTVPNAVLARAPIRNYSKPAVIVRRQLRVYASYDVAPKRVHQILLDAIRGTEGVLAEPRATVITTDFTERGVEYTLRWFVDDFARREPIRSEVHDRVWYALQRAKIAIGVPTQVIALSERGGVRADDERKRNVDELERALAFVDFLSALPIESRRLLAELATVRLYAPDETIIEEGAEGDELFVILRGEVRVLVAASGRRIEVAKLEKHGFFGEMSLMTGAPRAATVISSTETELLAIDKEAFRRVFESTPELVETVSKVLAARQEHLDESLARASESSISKQSDRSTELLTSIKKFFSL